MSLVLFGVLIVASLVVGIIGLIIRRKSFGPAENGADEVESMVSRDAAYYFNNVIMVVFAILLAYLTIASALPSWLPFGGQQVSTGTFDAIARPLGIIYLAILAVCPLLGWRRTQGKQFLKRAKVPGICALVLFVLLMVYFVTYLVPTYNDNVAYYMAQAYTADGLVHDESAVEMLTTLQPAWYYLGLTVVGLLVASVLFFNSLFMIGRAINTYKQAHGCSLGSALAGMITRRASSFGGFIAHLGMAVILVGLIGSSMFVTERVQYIEYDEESDTASTELTIQDFTLTYTGNEVVQDPNGDDIFYRVFFDVYRDGAYIGSVDPTIQFVQTTQQQKLIASVIGFPTEDLFVVYRGMSTDGELAMDVRVNPLISEVWAGFFLLMAGVVIATVGGRGASRKLSAKESKAADATDAGPADEKQTDNVLDY